MQDVEKGGEQRKMLVVAVSKLLNPLSEIAVIQRFALFLPTTSREDGSVREPVSPWYSLRRPRG